MKMNKIKADELNKNLSDARAFNEKAMKALGENDLKKACKFFDLASGFAFKNSEILRKE